MKDLKYMAAYLIPLSVIIGLLYGGYYSYTTILFAFVIMPLMESFLPTSKENIDEVEKNRRASSFFFDGLLYANLPLVYGILSLFMYRLLQNPSMPLYERTGHIISMGMVLGSNGINVAHELGHRKSKWEQLMAKLLLLPSFYMHYIIEHNKGHHKHVGTDQDPASARKNEPLYLFWFRSTLGGYRNAWRLESHRLKRSGKSFWSLDNDMLLFTFAQLAYLITIFYLGGAPMVWYFIGAGVLGFLNLETINYIEHYGLRRKKLPSGYYERASPLHSWNSNYEGGRIMLYELTRHSDHHYLASKKYQLLDHHDTAPELPFGYPTSMLISMVPPLWFRVMNKRIPQ